MVMKGYAKAHTHKGGYERWVYDEFGKVYAAIDAIEGADTTELTAAVEALQTAVGDNTSGLVKSVADLNTAVEDLTTRVGALETPSEEPGE